MPHCAFAGFQAGYLHFPIDFYVVLRFWCRFRKHTKAMGHIRNVQKSAANPHETCELAVLWPKVQREEEEDAIGLSFPTRKVQIYFKANSGTSSIKSVTCYM